MGEIGEEPLFGAIEAGGTKFLCAVGSREGMLLDQVRIPTTSPEETLGRALAYYRDQVNERGVLASIGIASFGPLDPRRDSPTFGQILATPKPGWTGTDIVSPFRDAFQVPVGFDTDVNGAALGEWRWGAGQGLDSLIYLTIGTGIGGGGLVDGALMHGLLHPEMGHIPLPHDRAADPFVGICPFHGDCFEGLASGPAIEERWGAKPESLAPDHPAWELEAHYLALALQSYICTLSPQRIILGGGVMQQHQLIGMIHEKTLAALSGYIILPQILERITEYIVPASLNGNSGLLGALALAELAVSDGG
ncbi:MAG: ROK family protein [Anaerolineales bacterium]